MRMRAVARRAGAAVVLAVVLGGASAGAHSGDPNVQTLVLGVTPSLPGVVISVVQTITPAISAVNGSPQELEILGPDGSPFLRLGPRGAEGNLNSPAFYRTAAPGGETSAPAGVDPRRPPAWKLLSHSPAWAWYEPRVPDIPAAPPSVRGRSVPVVLARWTLPLRYGTEGARVDGAVEYTPPTAQPLAQMTTPGDIAPGVTVALLPGRFPDLYLQNSGHRTVTVLGQQGEPFAQIGPGGVRVNIRSPIYAADALARGLGRISGVNAGRPPVYRSVSAQPSFDWFDPRPHFLARWSVPLRIGGRTVTIAGTLTAVAPLSPAAAHRRRAGGSGPDPLLLGGLALAVVIAVGGGLRANRLRASRLRASRLRASRLHGGRRNMR